MFGSNLIVFIKTLIVGNIAAKTIVGVIASLTFVYYIYIYNTRTISLALVSGIDSPGVVPCKLDEQDWWDSYSHPMSQTSKYKDNRVQPGSISVTNTMLDRLPYSHGDDLSVSLKSEEDLYLPLGGINIPDNNHKPHVGQNPFLRDSYNIAPQNGTSPPNPFIGELQTLPHNLPQNPTFGYPPTSTSYNPLATTLLNPSKPSN